MKNFPTARQILKAIIKAENGITLTELVKQCHPSFNNWEYRKDGHRALILEALVKTGFVKMTDRNNEPIKQYAFKRSKTAYYHYTGKKRSLTQKLLRRV